MKAVFVIPALIALLACFFFLRGKIRFLRGAVRGEPWWPNVARYIVEWYVGILLYCFTLWITGQFLSWWH